MSKIVIGKSKRGLISFVLETLLRTRLLIQANSGGGKSWLIRLLAELLFGKVQIIIIDREGEFASLRPKYGYLHVGQVSEGADIQVDVRSARLLAEKLLELGTSTICDLYEAFRTNPSGRRAWVAAFLEGLIDAPKALWHDCIVIVDEAHQFCPEASPKAASMAEREIISRCKEAMVALATVGRKRGYCAVWATQRLAKLDKDASAELFNRLVGMTIEDVDVDRAVELMSVSREDRHEFKETLRGLEPGNFFAFGRAVVKERTLFKVNAVSTEHPEAGSKGFNAKPPPVPEAIRLLLPKLADLTKEADQKAKTEADLKKEIASLKAQLASAERIGAAAVKLVKAPAPAKPEIRTETKIVEVPAITSDEEKRIHALLVRMEKLSHRFDPVVELQSSLWTWMKKLGVELSNAVEASENLRKMPPKPRPMLPAPTAKPPTRAPAKVLAPAIADSDAEEKPLLAGERKMLDILAKFHPGTRTRAQLAQLAGYAMSGGTFGNYFGTLRRRSLITEARDGSITITEKGLETFGGEVPEGPKDKEELLAFWQERLLAGERKMLDVLVESYPGTLSREELGERSGYEASGGTFGNYLGTLRRNELVTVDGDLVKANDSIMLFQEVS